MTQAITPSGRAMTELNQNEGETAGNQFLTFRLGDEEYGVDILRVREIKGWTPVTHIPNAPAFMKGVLNLRGTIVPIVDLRVRFNMAEVDYTPTTVVIVLSLIAAGRERIFGIVVDAVSDVLNIPQTDIRPKPDFGTVIDADFIKGLASVGEQMVLLLDIDCLLSTDEISAVVVVSE